MTDQWARQTTRLQRIDLLQLLSQVAAELEGSRVRQGALLALEAALEL